MSQKEATLLLRIKKTGEEALDSISDKIDVIRTAVLAAGAALVAFGYASVKAFREQELASNQLAQSMVQQGVYSTALRQKYEEMATALQRVTTFGDENIIAAQATLQAYVGQKEVTQDLVKATLDFAAAKGMDLKSAADLVGKSIGSETNMLSRYGIQVEMTKDKQQKMVNVMTALNGKFGGQAEAMAKGLGSVEQMKNAFSDFQENLGQRLAPIVSLVAKQITNFFYAMGSGVGILDDVIRGVLQLSAQGILFARDFEVVGKVIGNVFGGLAGTVMNLVQGNWKEAWNSAKNIATFSMEDIANANKAAYDKIAAMDQAYMEGKQANLKDEESRIAESNANKVRLADEHAQELAKKRLEQDIQEQDRKLQMMDAAQQDADQQIALQIKFLDDKLKNETDFHNRVSLVQQRAQLVDAQMKAKQAKLDEESNKRKIADMQATFSTISTLQQSNNLQLAAIGKAAAITQIAIDTPVAIGRALAAFPPPFNFAAAALVGTAMAAQAARIAGVQLAEGGIVSPTPGGTLATIGEGGRHEAVIPLPDGFDPNDGLGGGGRITIIANGPIMGDENQARQFAVAIDRELYKLRQRNESVAFDEDLF